MTHRQVLPAAVFVMALAASSSAWAVDKTFQPVSGSWSVAGNWSPTGIPGANDRAIIPAGRTATVATSQTVDYLTVYGLLILQDGVIFVVGCSGAINGAPFIDGTGEVRTPPNVPGPAFGTGRIEIRNAQTGMLVQQSMTLGNFTLNYTNSNPNSVSNAKMRLNNGISVLMNGKLDLLVGNLELGQSPPGGACTLNVRGDVNIAGISFIDFKANDSVCICGGNWTQLGTKFKDGTNTTLIFNATGNQTINVSNDTLGNVDYDNLIFAGTGAARTVTYNNNPLLAFGFYVSQNLVVGQNVTFILDDAVDPTANGGIGNGTAAFSLRIESGATAIFKRNYNNSARLLFRDTNDSGPLSNGTLRLEGTITDDSTELGSAFDPGLGTVEYAGVNVAQTIWTRINAATAISYYNLTIDNTGGVAATQEAAALTVANTVRIGKTVSGVTNTAAVMTAAATNVTVGNDFVCNAQFNHGGSTVILTCSLDDSASIMADIASPVTLTFNNLTISASLVGAVMDVVTAARNFAVANAFIAPRGKLTLSPGVTVDAQRGITVGDNILPAGVPSDAELELIGNVTFRVGATFSLSVNPDGIFFAGNRNSATAPVVTRVAGPGTFASSILGVVDITRLNYSFGNVNGLNIATSAARVLNLRNITFGAQDATLAGTLPADLTVAAPGLNFDCPGCVFGTLVAGGVNVRAKLPSAGNMLLRFEDRGVSPPGGAGGGGAGAGELLDDDNDANDNGLIDGADAAGGSIVQWVYTINLDVPGTIEGFPQPAFDWNTFNYYSTYVAMQNASGTADTLYVLNGEGDLASYSFTLPAVDIVGPAFWTTEGATHVVYFGTSDGRVIKLIDTGAALVAAPAPWDTAFSDPGNVLAVTSPVISDGTNIYFAAQTSGSPTYGVYKVAIATKTVPDPPLSIGNVPISSGFAWWTTLTGRYLYGASQASGGASYIGRAVTGTWTLDAVFSGSAMNPPADDCTSDFLGYVNIMNFNADPTPYLFVGEANGWMHGVKAAGTALEFLTQRPGFPFRDKVSAVQGGAIMDFFTGRLFYGNAAGDVYTLNSYPGSWVLNTSYFRFATPGAAAIRTMPLFENGILYASNSAGRVFVLDVNNGAGQTLLRAYNLGTLPLGDVSRDFTTNRIYVATLGGRLYSIPAMTDPTPGAP